MMLPGLAIVIVDQTAIAAVTDALAELAAGQDRTATALEALLVAYRAAHPTTGSIRFRIGPITDHPTDPGLAALAPRVAERIPRR